MLGNLFLGLAHAHEFFTCYSDDNVQYGVDIMSGKMSNTGFIPHRCVVLDRASENVYSVLTQSTVIEFLDEFLYAFGVGKQTLKELDLGFKTVYTCTKTDSVKDAFTKIVELGVSCIAVVDDDEQLIGKISTTDIKCAYEEGNGIEAYMTKTIAEV